MDRDLEESQKSGTDRERQRQPSSCLSFSAELCIPLSRSREGEKDRAEDKEGEKTDSPDFSTPPHSVFGGLEMSKRRLERSKTPH